MHDTMMMLYIKVQDLMTREDGQDLVEYALIASLFSLAAAAGMSGVATAITHVFATTSGTIMATSSNSP